MEEQEEIISLEEFRDFIENLDIYSQFQEYQLTYRLFMKLRKGHYKNVDFSISASDFIEDFWNRLDGEFQTKYWIPMQNACIQFLLMRGGALI